MSTIYLAPYISPGNDFDVFARVRKRNPSAPSQKIAATGLTVTMILSASSTTLAAISGTTTVTLSEGGSEAGSYLGTFTGLDLTTALGSIADGATLYVVVSSGTNARRILPVTVKKVLAPDGA